MSLTDFVALGWWETKRVRLIGIDGEIVHVIIENDPGGRGNKLGAERMIHRASDGDSIAILIYDAQMRRPSLHGFIHFKQVVIRWEGLRSGNLLRQFCSVLFGQKARNDRINVLHKSWITLSAQKPSGVRYEERDNRSRNNQ